MVDYSEVPVDGGAEIMEETANSTDQLDRLIAVLRMKGYLSMTEAKYVKTGELDRERFFENISFDEMESFLLEMKEKGKYTEEDIDQWKAYLNGN